MNINGEYNIHWLKLWTHQKLYLEKLGIGVVCAWEGTKAHTTSYLKWSVSAWQEGADVLGSGPRS